MVPKTTNRMAGYTPYPTYFKRPSNETKLFLCTGKTVRSVVRCPLQSVNVMHLINKMFYHILPDGNAAFFVSKGNPEGPVGWWYPALQAIDHAFRDPNSPHWAMTQRLNIKTVLPFVDVDTGMVKKYVYSNGTRETKYMSIVYTFDNVSDCTVTVCDEICTNLVREFNKLFQLKLVFGGNASNYGVQQKKKT